MDFCALHCVLTGGVQCYKENNNNYGTLVRERLWQTNYSNCLKTLLKQKIKKAYVGKQVAEFCNTSDIFLNKLSSRTQSELYLVLFWKGSYARDWRATRCTRIDLTELEFRPSSWVCYSLPLHFTVPLYTSWRTKLPRTTPHKLNLWSRSFR